MKVFVEDFWTWVRIPAAPQLSSWDDEKLTMVEALVPFCGERVKGPRFLGGTMSRSYKKVSITGVAGDSDKIGKRLAHKAFRRSEHIAVGRNSDPAVSMREVSDVWNFSKDGKRFYDAGEYPRVLRK